MATFTTKPSTTQSSQNGESAPAPLLHTLEHAPRTLPAYPSPVVMECSDVNIYYGDFRAVTDVNMAFAKNEITALIGPSGCGKSTLLRTLNRMNDLIPSASVHGSVRYHDQDLYASDIDPVQVRKRIGMVFPQAAELVVIKP